MKINSGVIGLTEKFKLSLRMKKKEIKKRIESQEEFVDPEVAHLEDIMRRAEQDKKIMVAEIIARKYAKGDSVLKEELDFLKEEHPQLYADAHKVRQEGKSLKKKLKNAKTKEEAQMLISASSLKIMGATKYNDILSRMYCEMLNEVTSDYSKNEAKDKPLMQEYAEMQKMDREVEQVGVNEEVNEEEVDGDKENKQSQQKIKYDSQKLIELEKQLKRSKNNKKADCESGDMINIVIGE